MSEVFDIDSLAPKPAKIKFGGQEIDVQPPDTLAALTIGELGQKMLEYSKTIDQSKPEETNLEAVRPLVEKMTAAIVTCIPELEGKHLTMNQLLKLVSILTEMGTPADVKELQAKGISPADPKPTA